MQHRKIGKWGVKLSTIGLGPDVDRPKQGVMINCDIGRTWHGAMHLSAFGPGGRGAMKSANGVPVGVAKPIPKMK